MAIPLSKLSLPPLGVGFIPNPPRAFSKALPPARRPLFGPAELKSGAQSTKQRGHKASVAKDETMTSIITELERKQAEEFPSQGHLQPDAGLPARWREIHGQDDWAGLLDPIDPMLRSEIIRYGEFCQATYDSYDYATFSRYSGSCKYPRRHFFESLGFADCGYDVTRYIYATSNIKLPNFFTRSSGSRIWSERANWIGYVAVSNDDATKRLGRRDILVAWRGTVTRLEWVADLMDFLRPVNEEGIPCPDPDVKVESGFIDLYTDKDPTCRFCKYSAREQVLTEVRKLVQQYAGAGEEVSISVTGHSLGSALAMLSAYDVAEMGLNKSASPAPVPVTVFSFAGPRVGNRAFKQRFEAIGVKALRVVNVHDKVPKVPGMLVNEHVPKFLQKLVEDMPWSYSHVGVELALDHQRSPFLKDTIDISDYHNLEAHLHLLDGFHGSGEKFALATGRDPALVNKSCDFLAEHLMVPPNWRQDENKGMVRTADGRWMQPERQTLDDHPPDVHHHLAQLGLGKKDVK